jgi:hypothetical protein
MADTAAHLVDRVLPEAPVRQWVLTVPFALRYRLAYDAALTSLVLREFVREVLASYRRRARECGPSRRRRGGAVTFIQRFGDALNLNVHFHTLMLDGVYERYGEPGMGFRGLTPPDDDEVRRVVERVARRGDRIDPEDLSAPAAPRCAAAMGFTLHADVAVPARDRPRLERLCRYVARPPVATERLERLPDGRLLYHLRHRWRDGTTRIVFEPHQLLARLVPLIPAPRAHQVRYHGVLAPCAGWRDRVVPGGPAAEAGDTARPPDREAAEPSTAAVTGRPLRRYPWADLLRRVFAVDVLECPDCGGPMRILAAIHRKSSLNPVALIVSRPGPIVGGFFDFRSVRAAGRKAG